MTTTHILGFPRIGAQRELKQALEAYWRGEQDAGALEACGRMLRARHWALQRAAALDYVTVGDFSFYDHVLDLSLALDVVPARCRREDDLVTYFTMARGRAPGAEPAAACEMTKWFDTNYHYIVPEFEAGQRFRLRAPRIFQEVEEARALGHPVKAVLPGPLTYLWLGKAMTPALDRLQLLDELLPVYGELLDGLAARGVEWVQVDEPILVLDLPPAWRQAFEAAYHRLQSRRVKLLLATYFGGLEDHLELACRLPVAGLHLDLVRAPEQLAPALDRLPPYKVLSLGVVDGRNVWRTPLDAVLERLAPVRERLGERLWLAPSCSLLHVPVDLTLETELDGEIREWLAFAVQKLEELALLKRALDEGPAVVSEALAAARDAWARRRRSPRLYRLSVRGRLEAVSEDWARRASPYAQRRAKQRARLDLPLLPTTTIGSFPQTAEIRAVRRRHRSGELSEAEYRARIRAEIETAIRRQEALGLDVLVHGEAERSDMVEYFGERLEGFAFTRHGWVQSYGSRCVKPPILYGDVERPAPMTVDWFRYAQSLTEKPVKGMLTGPVTLLNWSFVRDDQPRAATCLQLALALRDEVRDLEAAGAAVIQIDEAALREGLPLRRRHWQAYLEWAVQAFRVAACAVRDETQIHTHMCYSEFNDIIEAIAAMDADVVTIESARSRMNLLEAFRDFEYPNEIGPGVYDIHSPNVPSVDEIEALLRRALACIPAERLWVNPDCGLKTRAWPEVEAALANMVAAARRLRAELQGRAA